MQTNRIACFILHRTVSCCSFTCWCRPGSHSTELDISRRDLVRGVVAEALGCLLATHIVLVRKIERARHHEHHDHVDLVPVSLVTGELVGCEDVAVAGSVGGQRDLQHSRDPRQQEDNATEHSKVPESQHVREVRKEEGVEGGAEDAVEDEADHEEVALGGVQHQQHRPDYTATDAQQTRGREAPTVHQSTHREDRDHTCNECEMVLHI